MEIRCGGCNKLFRISDEKITGKGIKFACTRCGAYVKVTKEEFEQYAISKSAVSALDLFEEKPKPEKASLPIPAEEGVTEEPAHTPKIAEHASPSAPDIKQEEPASAFEELPTFAEPTSAAETKDFGFASPSAPDIKPEEAASAFEELPTFAEPTSAAETKDFGFASPSAPDIKQEEPAPAFEEPLTLAEPTTAAEVKDLEHATPSVPEEQAPLFEEPAPSAESIPVAEYKSEPAPEPESVAALKAEPPVEYEQKPKTEAKPEPPKQVPIEEPVPILKPEPEIPETYPQRANEPKTETARTALAAPLYGSSITTPVSQREPASYAAPAREKSTLTTADAPSRSMNRYLVYLVMLVIIGLVGYGVFSYIGPGAQKEDELSKQISSTEGLRIVTASGAVEPDGDLLITCTIENSLNKERPVWYVVVDVYNAQGAVLNKIRSFSGKQLYTQREYEILSRRGVNVQELKAKNLLEQGIVIPPKGSVTFEMRYMQPVSGVSNFDASIHPFDPIRLFRELAEEIR